MSSQDKIEGGNVFDLSKKSLEDYEPKPHELKEHVFDGQYVEGAKKVRDVTDKTPQNQHDFQLEGDLRDLKDEDCGELTPDSVDDKLSATDVEDPLKEPDGGKDNPT